MRDSGIMDTSNSFGNLYTGAPAGDKAEPQTAIGKEDIRIPINISMVEKNSVERIQQKLANVAICEVSGCTFPIAINPALSLEFFWRSPLAVRKNAIKISFLPLKEMALLPAEYLAGTILSLLSSESLIEDKIEASERNAILCNLFTNSQMVEAIILVRRIVESGTRKELPKIAFSNWNKENFLSYLNDCMEIITPTRIVKTEAEKELALLESAKVSISIRTKIARKRNEAILSLNDEDEISREVEGGAPPGKRTAAQMLKEWQDSRKEKK